MVSPGLNAGRAFSRLFLAIYLLNSAVCMTISVKLLVYNRLGRIWLGDAFRFDVQSAGRRPTAPASSELKVNKRYRRTTERKRLQAKQQNPHRRPPSPGGHFLQPLEPVPALFPHRQNQHDRGGPKLPAR